MADDPFRHLHVEDYTEAYEHTRVGSDSMVFMGGRARISLAGEWRFVLDLFDEGLRQHWYRDPPADPLDFDRPRDHDWGDWQSTTVPSCWNLQHPHWRYFEGSGWYSRTFDTPALPPGGTLLLRIGAANYTCRVFLNGHCAGVHRGGSTPFFINLTSLLVPADNQLHIQVENRRQHDRVPMHHIDWFNYGGLYRDVDLVVLPENYIRELRTALDSDGQIHVQVAVSDTRASSVTVQIPELGIDESIALTDGAGTVRIAANPVLWSPESPRLYDVFARCQDDRVSDRVGFRTLATRGTELLLNGKPLWLQGVCCHEDDLELGKSVTEHDLRRRFEHVRQLGANTIRLTHYPHHERVAELADEIGVLLIEEIPVYWAIDFANLETLIDATNQLQELISRDWNRASVILWGIGNENADTDERLSFMTSLADSARAADPTRLLTAACLINRQSFRIEDRLSTALDVIGLNEYFGWYEKGFEPLRRLFDNSYPGKPVIIAETGADAAPETNNRDQGQLFTESHQAHLLENQIKIARSVAYVRGIFPWLLYDYRTERRQTSVQRGWSRKGLIERDKNTLKKAFNTVRELYRS